MALSLLGEERQMDKVNFGAIEDLNALQLICGKWQ
jgi:hypothetical protein